MDPTTPEAMGRPHAVVRIVARGACLGSGFIVGRNAILTCAHVVHDPRLGQLAPEQLTVVVESAPAKPSSETHQARVGQVRHRWRQAAKSSDDYALLSTLDPLEAEPLTFLEGLTSAALAGLSGHLCVHGYRGIEGEPGMASGLRVRGTRWLQEPLALLRTAQLDGGLPAGLSGAPVLVGTTEGLSVAGMVMLGGEGAASSAFYGTDLLLAFLRAEGVEPKTRPARAEHPEDRRWGTVLISYASSDLEEADALRSALALSGFHASLLDYGEVSADASSARWEDLLHRARALVAVWSESARSSDWSAVEIAHAIRMGKTALAVRLDDAPLHGQLQSSPVIDLRLTSDRGDALKALCAELDKLGLLRETWDGRRPPYPGLSHFEEADSPVFFGREPQIERCLSTLAELRRMRRSSGLVLLGASGAGKSSLLRAGILPRIRKHEGHWIPLGPLRPSAGSLDSLAQELSAAFGRFGVERDWKEVRDILAEGSTTDLRDLFGDLRVAAQAREGCGLFLVDQIEEALTDLDDEVGALRRRFFHVIGCLCDAAWSQSLVVLTLRHDFLGAFQNHPELGKLAVEHIVLDPMAQDDVTQVVLGPARLAGIHFEPALVAAMVTETPSPDALPLLAFTLRKLYDRRIYTLSGYREELKGIHGAVAQAADAVLSRAQQDLSAFGMEQLRSALLLLARIGDDEQVTRRRVRWDALPCGGKRSVARGSRLSPTDAPIHRCLERFVDARLLVSDKPTRELEVTHEALFRAWPTLQEWIRQSAGLLAWRRRVEPQVERFLRFGPKKSSLLQGPDLAEARIWLKREPLLISADERAFIEESARRARRRTKRAWVLLGTAVLLIVVGHLWALIELGRAAQMQKMLSALKTHHPDERVLILREILAPEQHGLIWRQSALDALGERVRSVRVPRLGRGVLSARLSRPDGRSVVLSCEDGRATVRTSTRDAPSTLSGHTAAVRSASLSPDGARVVTASDDGTARIWNTDGSGTPIVLQGHTSSVLDAAFSPDGRRVVTASADATARVWNADGAAQSLRLAHAHAVVSVAFGPDGRRIATGSADGIARVWDTTTGGWVRIGGHPGTVTSVDFAPDGRQLVTTSTDGAARTWSARGEGLIRVFWHETRVLRASFQGSHVITIAADRKVRLFRSEEEAEPLVLQDRGVPLDAVLLPGESQLLSAARADDDQLVLRTWPVGSDALMEALWSVSIPCLSVSRRQQLLDEDLDEARAAQAACLRGARP